MKTSKEIADSVFEKSRVVIKKRQIRRKRIAAASATLGAAAVITVLAFYGNGALTGGAPVASAKSEPTSQSLSSPASASTGNNVSSSQKAEGSSAKEDAASRAGSTPSAAESRSEKDTSHRNESSRASSAVSTPTAPGGSAIQGSRELTSARDSEEESSSVSSSKNSSGKASSSSKADSSASVSSRAASSRTASTRSNSSRASSSKAASSRVTSSKTNSSAVISEDPISSDTPSVIARDTDSPAVESDIDSPLPDSDVWNGDDGPQVKDEDQEKSYPVPSIPGASFCKIYYIDNRFDSVGAIVDAADRIVIATITDIDFERLSGSTAVLREDVGDEIIPEYCGDIVSVYSAEVIEDLTPGGGRTGDTVEFRLYGGVSGWREKEQQAICGHNYVPLVFTGKTIENGGTYLLLLDDHNSVKTLVDPLDGFFNIDKHSNTQYEKLMLDLIMGEL